MEVADLPKAVSVEDIEMLLPVRSLESQSATQVACGALMAEMAKGGASGKVL